MGVLVCHLKEKEEKRVSSSMPSIEEGREESGGTSMPSKGKGREESEF